MNELTMIVAGSAAGGVARYWLAGAVDRRYGERFPWGTLAVNASGALAIGMIAAIALADERLAAWGLWHLAVIGFLGSYTTVSSFSLQTLVLARNGTHLAAAAYVALSLVLCLGGAALGYAAAAALLAAR